MMERPAAYSSLRRFGDIKTSAKRADHDGWVLLDGRTISRASFPKFFAAIEVTEDSVKLPDGKDAVLVGAGGRLKVLERGGSNEITLSIDNMPAHDHGYVDTYPEAATQKAGILSGVLTILAGVTAKTKDSVSKKTGSGKPVKLEPIGIGVNLFIYIGAAK